MEIEHRVFMSQEFTILIFPALFNINGKRKARCLPIDLLDPAILDAVKRTHSVPTHDELSSQRVRAVITEMQLVFAIRFLKRTWTPVHGNGSQVFCEKTFGFFVADIGLDFLGSFNGYGTLMFNSINICCRICCEAAEPSWPSGSVGKNFLHCCPRLGIVFQCGFNIFFLGISCHAKSP